MTYTAVNIYGSVTELTPFRGGLRSFSSWIILWSSSQLTMLLMHMHAIKPRCKIWKHPVSPPPPNQSSRVRSIPEWGARGGSARHLSVGNEFRCVTTLEMLSNCLPSSLDVFKGLTLGINFQVGSHASLPLYVKESKLRAWTDIHAAERTTTLTFLVCEASLTASPPHLGVGAGPSEGPFKASNLESFSESPPNKEYLHAESL